MASNTQKLLASVGAGAAASLLFTPFSQAAWLAFMFTSTASIAITVGKSNKHRLQVLSASAIALCTGYFFAATATPAVAAFTYAFCTLIPLIVTWNTANNSPKTNPREYLTMSLTIGVGAVVCTALHHTSALNPYSFTALLVTNFLVTLFTAKPLGPYMQKPLTAIQAIKSYIAKCSSEQDILEGSAHLPG